MIEVFGQTVESQQNDRSSRALDPPVWSLENLTTGKARLMFKMQERYESIPIEAFPALCLLEMIRPGKNIFA